MIDPFCTGPEAWHCSVPIDDLIGRGQRYATLLFATSALGSLQPIGVLLSPGCTSIRVSIKHRLLKTHRDVRIVAIGLLPRQ